MRHIKLKIDIKVAQAEARIQRAEGTKLIAQGRKLRKRSQAESDVEKKTRLFHAGETCRDQGIDLRATANYGRQDRRHLSLAAAMLNGKTYEQCEKKCDPQNKPQKTRLAPYIQPYLLAEEKKHAEFIAQTWLKEGNIRLVLIRNEKLGDKLAFDQKMAAILATKTEIANGESALRAARTSLREASRYVETHQKTVDQWSTQVRSLQERCQIQEAELQAEKDQEALKTSQVVTQGVDDLFAQP